MSKRFARNGWPTNFSIHTGVLTGSATPHAEGAYTEIVASLAADVCAIRIGAGSDVSLSTVDTSMLVSLAVGGAGTETVIVSNLVQGGTQGVASGLGYWLWVPIHIPSGSRLAGKLRAEQVSDTYSYRIEILYGGRMPGWGGYALCQTLGDDTANSRGTVISNTAGSWTEITASTSAPIRAINMSAGIVDNASVAASHVVDVGVGGAGAEEIIGTWRLQTTVQEGVFSFFGPPWVEIAVAAGSRIAVKKDTTADLSVAVHGWS